MKETYYKILVWTSYQIGDFVCNIDTEWAASLYQKCMLFSYDCDEKIGFWYWNEPKLEKKEDL